MNIVALPNKNPIFLVPIAIFLINFLALPLKAEIYQGNDGKYKIKLLVMLLE